MAAIKAHGSLISTATNRVLVTLYEKELEFEFVSVDMSTGEHKKDHFLSLNVRKLNIHVSQLFRIMYSIAFPIFVFPNIIIIIFFNLTYTCLCSHLVKFQL